MNKTIYNKVRFWGMICTIILAFLLFFPMRLDILFLVTIPFIFCFVLLFFINKLKWWLRLILTVPLPLLFIFMSFVLAKFPTHISPALNEGFLGYIIISPFVIWGPVILIEIINLLIYLNNRNKASAY